MGSKEHGSDDLRMKIPYKIGRRIHSCAEQLLKRSSIFPEGKQTEAPEKTALGPPGIIDPKYMIRPAEADARKVGEQETDSYHNNYEDDGRAQSFCQTEETALPPDECLQSEERTP